MMTAWRKVAEAEVPTHSLWGPHTAINPNTDVEYGDVERMRAGDYFAARFKRVRVPGAGWDYYARSDL